MRGNAAPPPTGWLAINLGAVWGLEAWATMTGGLAAAGRLIEGADRRAGAGLRIGGHRDGAKNSGDNDWMDAKFEFEVAELAKSIDLVCDLRADKGEMWVDLDSLKLRKLPATNP